MVLLSKMDKDDDVRLTIGLPRMEAKVHRCRLCDAPIDTMGELCWNCLGGRYYTEALRQQREHVVEHPAHAWETALDRGHRRHLVLAAHPRLAWCGRELMLLVRVRQRLKAPFPVEVCGDCRRIYGEFREEKKS